MAAAAAQQAVRTCIEAVYNGIKLSFCPSLVELVTTGTDTISKYDLYTFKDKAQGNKQVHCGKDLIMQTARKYTGNGNIQTCYPTR